MSIKRATAPRTVRRRTWNQRTSENAGSDREGPGAGHRTLRLSALGRLLYRPRSRPLRFAAVGGSAGLIQIGLLTLLAGRGWHPLAANAAALMAAAQVNFALSSMFTWRDRFRLGQVPRRWVTYHASIAATAILNMLVFASARAILPVLLASLLGILMAAMANFAAADRFVFRAAASPVRPAPTPGRAPAPHSGSCSRQNGSHISSPSSSSSPVG